MGIKIISRPDEHDCHTSLQEGNQLPFGTVVECDCGRQYLRREDQRDGLYWAIIDTGNHGWTRHGHPCCQEAPLDKRPNQTGRCGERICTQCAVERNGIHAGVKYG